MSKQHFFLKLIPPRPTFATDITPEEQALMAQHGAYCQKEFEAGKLLAYGPVMAPDGAFGMGILEVADEAEAASLARTIPQCWEG